MTTYVGEVLKKDASGNLSIVELRVIDNGGNIVGSEATSQETGVEYKIDGVSLGPDAPEIRSGSIEIRERVTDFLGGIGTFNVAVDYFTDGTDTYYMLEPSFFADDVSAIVNETLGGAEIADIDYSRWHLLDSSASFYAGEVLLTVDSNLTDGLPELSGIQRKWVGVIDDDGTFELAEGGDNLIATETGNRPAAMSDYVPVPIRIDFASVSTAFGSDNVNDRPNAVSATISVDLSSVGGGIGVDATFTGLLFSSLDNGEIYTFLMVPAAAGIDLSDVNQVMSVTNVQKINGQTLAEFGFTTDLYQTDLNNTDDFYYGEYWNDLINGLDGRDLIFGETGNDEIFGGAGNDELYGGAQDDILHGGTDNDVLNGGIGDDQLFGDADDDILNGDRGNDILKGGAGIDELNGDVGADQLNGGGDDDILFGDEGTDSLDGGDGMDDLNGGTGNDTLLGGVGNDTLHGDDGADSLDGGDGIDDLFGGAGGDTLLGKAGNDTLRGEGGSDQLDGGDDDDELRGGTGNDTLLGKAGIDLLKGEGGNDGLEGGSGDDTLMGGSGRDDLKGGADNDILKGGDDNDTLRGGDGDDNLYGQAGNDRFAFDKNDGTDTIKDFQHGFDRIDLSDFGFTSKATALTYFFEKGSATNDVCGFAKNGTTITIKGVDLGDISNSDIII
ncbi:MAG: hypothetical protein H6874_00310 [Hyphomicrobiaceae bacterium]|nr:hypothetical protein [Hyphomicrobiaceae bacterium]